MKKRLDKFDNLRFLLMFVVVFGHILEIYSSPLGNQVYRVIYSFHMPLFIFISGYFAKYDRKKILTNLIYPYVVFQVLYLSFLQLILHKPDVIIQFTTPYWILWYLVAISFCYLLLPLFSVVSWKKRVLVVGALFGIGLLAGYENTIGYYLSLSRFLSFLPFFVMGYFAKDGMTWLANKKIPKKTLRIGRLATVALIIAAVGYVIQTPELTPVVFYHSLSYDMAKSNIFLKLSAYIVALIWIGSLFVLVPNRKIPMVTSLGCYTLPVYLLHGFIIRLVASLHLGEPIGHQKVLFAVGLAYGLLLLFSNSFMGRVLDRMFTANWIFDLIAIIKNRNRLWG